MSSSNQLTRIDDISTMLHVCPENVYRIAGLDNQWLVAAIFVYLHSIIKSGEFQFRTKIDIRGCTQNVGQSRCDSCDIKIKDQRSFLPYLLPGLSRKVRGWVESKVHLLRWSEKSWIVDRMIVMREGWRTRRGWCSKPLDLLSRHRIVVNSLHALCSLNTRKLLFQDVSVCRSAAGDKKFRVWARL